VVHLIVPQVDTFDMESVRTPISPDRTDWKYLSPLDERRVSSRERVAARGIVSEKASRFGGETEGQMVEVFDLTLHGVGFRAPVEFAVGAVHNIIVMAGPLRLTSRFRIASCRGADRIGEFDIGGQFC
jgi:hypothetical protein